MSGVGPHACTLARRQGISRPLRSHVGPYAGRKLVEKVEKVMTSRKWIIDSSPSQLFTPLDPPHSLLFFQCLRWKKLPDRISEGS